MSESEFDDDLQNELIEIFSEEAEEIFENLAPLLQQWKDGDNSEDLVISIKRAYHTLKGSGRMVGAADLGELAYSGEQYFFGLSNKSITVDTSHYALVELMTSALKDMAAAFKEKRGHDIDSNAIISLMSSAISGKAVANVPVTNPAHTDESESIAFVSVNRDIEQSVDDETTISAIEEISYHDQSDEPSGLGFNIEEELLEVFIEEAEEIIPEIQENIKQWSSAEADQACFKSLHRAFHTLKGSGRMVGAVALGDICQRAESYFEARVSGLISHDKNHISLIEQVFSNIKVLIQDFSNKRKPSINISKIIESMDSVLINKHSLPVENQDLDQELPQVPKPAVISNSSDVEEVEMISYSGYQEESVKNALNISMNRDASLDFIDDDLIAIFVEEAEEIFPDIDKSLKELMSRVNESSHVKTLNRYFHTIKGSARMIGADEISKIAYKGEEYFNSLMAGLIKINDSHFPVFEEALSALKILVRDVSNKSTSSIDINHIIKKMDNMIFGDYEIEELEVVGVSVENSQPRDPDFKNYESKKIQSKDQEDFEPVPDFVDDELIEIFFEEAQEIFSVLNSCFPKWKSSPDDERYLTEVRRAFHTLKGSGRLMGASVIGELAWATENLLNRVIDGTIPVSQSIVNKVTETVEYLPSLIDSFKNRTPITVDTSNIEKELFDLADPAKVQLHDNIPTKEESELLSIEEEEDDFDNELLDVFLNECESHLEVVKEFINETDGRHLPVQGDFQRALHTLKGSSNMAKVQSMIEIITPTELLAKDYFNYHLKTNEQFTLLLKEFVELVQLEMKRLADRMLGVSSHAERVQRYLKDLNEHHEYIKHQVVRETSVNNQQGTVEEFMMAVMDPASSLEGIIENLQSTDTPKAVLIKMKPHLQKINEASQDNQYEKIRAITTKILKAIDKYSHQPSNVQDLYPAKIETAYNTLVSLLDHLAMGQVLPGINEVLSALDHIENSEVHHDQENNNISLEDEIPFDYEIAQELDSSFESEEGIQELVNMFLAESADIMDNIASNLKRWKERPDHVIDVEELQREFHTLKGGARFAKLTPIAQLAHQLESIYEAIFDGRYIPSASLFNILDRSHGKIIELIEVVQFGGTLESVDSFVEEVRQELSELEKSVQIKRGDQNRKAEMSINDPVIANSTSSAAMIEKEEIAYEVNDELDAIDHSKPISDHKPIALPEKSINNPFEGCDIDNDLLGIFLEEAQELSDAIDKALDQWRAEPDKSRDIVQELQRHMHTLKGGARMAGVTPLGDCAHEFEDFVKKAETEKPDDVYFETIDSFQRSLADLLAKSKAYARGEFNQKESTPEPQPVSKPVVAPKAKSETKINPFAGCDIDNDLLGIFLEEAQELSDAINKALDQWRTSPNNNRPIVQELQRHMHTLKGGARMAGVTPLGDCAHEFEDFVKKAETQEPDGDYFKSIDHYQKTLSDLLAQVKAYAKGEFNETETPQEHDQIHIGDLSISHEGRLVLPTKQGTLPSKDEWKSAQTDAASGEMVRVASPLLELLVNLAGETSIIRGRVEQEVTDIGYVLTEMEMTIDRLREQLRRLELETEAQIRSHYETSARARNEDFDPLEMDQYSTINQLTRALSESSSDLSDLKDTLQNKKRDTETLLLQQSRTNSQLQENLMKTRMVPFSRLVPRLQRVVRQVAAELGKDVEFKVVDSAGEMDRTIMEKMVAPLEHMLRNAVDHGMEMPDERISIGKTRKGRVTLHLTKEGAQAVLRLTDDGRGIDTDRVREKAIEKGMMTPDVQLSESELLQFIYHSGFSTATKVTQVSGRGVGMDVVNTEIKTLGGSLRVNSTKGVGTQFTTRLPLTVSTTRSLMVKVHDNMYAVPISQIEGVVRISPFELERYFRDENRLFEYAGVDYHVRYLGYYLSAEMKPVIDPNARPKPAMLVRGADRDTALQVDEVVGSREVVVKTVGSQLASISGLSGATILGDGNVIVILDLHALIRAELAQRSMSRLEAKLRGEQSSEGARHSHAARTMEVKRATPIVMVVDDSVTVRKVTTRFLERNGFEVATAKDGVDAVSQLREVKPDLILLDIEMPRMDGFEVASFIRHDSNLKNIPIIMITSRTGEKHRERAMSIGVNEYLGKPFQETNLLEMIHRFVEVQVDG